MDQYLNQIGGVALVTLFFLWSIIQYVIYFRKSSWKAFFKQIKASITELFKNDSKSTAAVGKANKDEKEKKSAESKSSKIKDKTDTTELSEEVDAIDDENEEINEQIEIKEFDTIPLVKPFPFEALQNSQKVEINDEALNELKGKIEEAFKTQGITLKQRGITIGPRLIRFEYDFPEGIKLKEIEKKQEEISFRLGGMELDIELPISGTDMFGVYVARETPDKLGLGSYLGEIENQQEEIPLLLGIGTGWESMLDRWNRIAPSACGGDHRFR
jgi:hypothetical protein